MTQRIVLTIAQARTLQRTTVRWPAQWAFVLMEEREKADTLADPQRMMGAMKMKALGCEDDQIAEQLGWKPGSTPLRKLARLRKSD